MEQFCQSTAANHAPEITIASGETLQVVSTGQVKAEYGGDKYNLEKVLHVSNIAYNLLSVP